MKKVLILLGLFFGFSTMANAQTFNFGAGLGFLNHDADGNLVITVPVEFPMMHSGDTAIQLRTNADFILDGETDVSLLISPLFQYRINPLEILPIYTYVGPSFRWYIEDAFIDTRVGAWSFLGGVAGVRASLADLISGYAEVTYNVGNAENSFSISTGIILSSWLQ